MCYLKPLRTEDTNTYSIISFFNGTVKYWNKIYSYKVLVSKYKGMKEPGRPRLKRKYNIKTDLNESGSGSAD